MSRWPNEILLCSFGDTLALQIRSYLCLKLGQLIRVISRLSYLITKHVIFHKLRPFEIRTFKLPASYLAN